MAAPDANRLRRDGLRWIPAVNGDFNVLVLSIHTLGSIYVQQSYAKRALSKSSKLLVQRAQLRLRFYQQCRRAGRCQVHHRFARPDSGQCASLPSGRKVTHVRCLNGL